MSMALTTPAQKPRGLRRRTCLIFAGLPLWLMAGWSSVVVVTLISIPRMEDYRAEIEPYVVQAGRIPKAAEEQSKAVRIHTPSDWARRRLLFARLCPNCADEPFQAAQADRKSVV